MTRIRMAFLLIPILGLCGCDAKPAPAPGLNRAQAAPRGEVASREPASPPIESPGESA